MSSSTLCLSEIVKILLENGADPYIENDLGMNAFDICEKSGPFPRIKDEDVDLSHSQGSLGWYYHPTYSSKLNVSTCSVCRSRQNFPQVQEKATNELRHILVGGVYK